MGWFFWFFFVSGFCSVLCELIWLRLAMAQFGVTTALTSIVLSVFMAGLGAGSWLAGTLVHRYGDRIKFPALRLYGLLELMIGISALVVPAELVWGHRFLESLADRAAVSSAAYYVIAGLWLAGTMVPFCACMGGTIPVAMFAIRKRQQEDDRRSFSFLYLANVLGAVLGSFLPLLLIEPYGFHKTLLIGAALNATIAVSAFVVSLASRAETLRAASASSENVGDIESDRGVLVLLFTTGLATMGMELIWIRLFTPYIGPVVYSFGMILVAYLLATYTGSQIYRYWSRTRKQESRLMWVSLALLGVLPLLTADVRVPIHLVARVFVGVMPFAGMIGFLTPMLVDRWSGGDPDRAGRAYAVNVVGCIVGPLLCGFLLLPLAGERWSALLLALPWFAMAFFGASGFRRFSRVAAYGILVTALGVMFASKGFETQFPVRRVLRDSTATVIAEGEGMQRRLLVNGMGMTKLNPITKMMAHLTLASLDHTPHSALIICFGMGTTFRSALTWNISTTAVELVPSVPKLFSYYHADADEVRRSPLAHLVIDDGRRFLERTPTKYDAILVDPPPPVQTAGSSLLYSRDFYAVAKQRLAPGGILQQWLPEADAPTQAATARAIKNSFAYVRVFPGILGWGWHFLASDRPIPKRTAAELVARMPARAVSDMMEWGPAASPVEQVNLLLSRESSTDAVIALSPGTVTLTDDRPINEFFLLRTPFDQLMAME